MPEVGTVTVHAQAIPYVRDLPGRVAPMRIAEVRARVSGLVVKRLFEQGSQVKEGDILYKVDPAPFEVELASAEAALARQEAALVLAKQQADRWSSSWPAPRRAKRNTMPPSPPGSRPRPRSPEPRRPATGRSSTCRGRMSARRSPGASAGPCSPRAR